MPPADVASGAPRNDGVSVGVDGAIRALRANSPIRLASARFPSRGPCPVMPWPGTEPRYAALPYVKTPPSPRHEPIALAIGAWRPCRSQEQPEAGFPSRSEEPSVSKAEDPTVRADEPVTTEIAPVSMATTGAH